MDQSSLAEPAPARPLRWHPLLAPSVKGIPGSDLSRTAMFL